MLSTTTVTLLASLTSLSRVENQVTVAAQRAGVATNAAPQANDESERILAETQKAQNNIGIALLGQAFDTRA